MPEPRAAQATAPLSSPPPPPSPYATTPDGAGLLVIGAGYGRTGTASTKAALEILGFGPTHHMGEVMKNAAFQEWTQVAEVPAGDPDGQRRTLLAGALQGYRSSIDAPTAIFYADLLEMYPNAKVILTTRDEDAWFASAWDTILYWRRWAWGSPEFWSSWEPLGYWLATHTLPVAHRMDRMHHALFPEILAASSEADFRQVFREWQASVEAAVPAERLLKFRVTEGFGPLSDFLGVPPPADGTPFPHANDKAIFRLRIQVIAAVGYAVVLAAGVVTFLLLRCLCTGGGRGAQSRAAAPSRKKHN